MKKLLYTTIAILGFASVSIAQPTIVNITQSSAGPRSANLNWTKSNSFGNPIKYKIYRGTTTLNLALVDSNVIDTFYFDQTGLTAGLTYFYNVVPKDNITGALGLASNTVSVVPNRIWHVSVNGLDSLKYGFSFYPLSKISTAIARAQSLDTVFVFNGMYVENINFSGKNLLLMSNYNYTKNDSDIKNTIIDGGGYSLSRTSVVKFANGENNLARLVGFTIQNGNCSNTTEPSGGGIYCSGSAPIIENCIIKNNTVSYSGGGIISKNNASPILRNLIIRNNYANGYGGGIAAMDGSSINVVNSLIFSNNSSSWGSGIAFTGSANGQLTNCIIDSNYGGNGAVYQENSNGGGYMTLRNNSIVRNKSNSAIYLYWGGLCNVINSIIFQNGIKEVDFSFNYTPNTLNISNSLIDTSKIIGTNGYKNIGNGVFYSYPSFVDTFARNYQLNSYSKCIGRGDTTNCPIFDYSGGLRPNPLGSKPDLGAFESQYALPSSKIDSVKMFNNKMRVVWTFDTTYYKSSLLGYKIFRDTILNSYRFVDSVGPTFNKYDDSTIVNDKRYYYTIQNIYNLNLNLCYSNVGVGAISNPPNLLSPVNNIISYTRLPLLLWNKKNYAKKYRLQFGVDSNFFSTLKDSITADTTIRIYNTLAYNTIYFWRVQCIDSIGLAMSNWSAVNKFQTELSVPMLTSLSTLNQKITINWSQTPSLNILRYRIYQDTVSNPTKLIDSVSAGIYSYTDSNIVNSKIYYYRVVAINNQLVPSIFSNERRAGALAIATLASPSNNTSSVTRLPLLLWNQNPFATKYRLQFGLDSTFAVTIKDTIQSGLSKQITSTLLYNTNYFWRVQCQDSIGTSNWSTINKFQTELSVPQITSMSTLDKRITLNWIQTPNTNILRYLIYRDTVANASVLIDSVNAGIYSYTDSNIVNSKIYYYRLVAINNQLVPSIYSNERKAGSLAITTLSSPLNNATAVSRLPLLVWNQNPFATKYRVQFGLDSNFISNLNDTVQVGLSKQITSTLLYNTNYFWRVQSQDSIGTSSWSEVNKFQTELSVPTLTSLSTLDKRITLNWDHTPNTNIYQYLIYRDTFENATVLIDSVNAGIYTYTDSNIVNNKIYYYRVVAINNQLVPSIYSNERKAGSLAITTLSSPLNKATAVSRLPLLVWNQNPNATKYRVQLGLDSTFSITIKDTVQVGLSKQITSTLLYNTNYFWRVQSQDSIGTSSWSEVNKFHTELSVPMIDSVIAGNHKNRIYWSYADTTGINHFKVYRGDSVLSNPLLIYSSIGNLKRDYTDNNLANNLKYYYYVKAINYDSILSENSNIKSGVTFNIKPIIVKLKDVRLLNQGRNIANNFTFNSFGSIDLDGTIDSLVWFVNNKRIKSDTALTYGFRQGTSKVKLIAYDSDLASDSSIAYIHISTFVKPMAGAVVAGLSAINPNMIYAADDSYINGLGANMIVIDSSGRTNFNLIVIQQIKTTPSISYDTTILITNGSLLNGFNKSGSPLFGAISLGGITEVTPTVDSNLNRIYLGVSNKKFFAFNYKNGGQLAWDYTCDAPIISSAVITSDRKLIFPDAIGNLYGFDISTNNSQGLVPKWKYNAGDSINTSPAIDLIGNIYVGTKTGRILKLTFDSNGTVSQVWNQPLNSPTTTSPVIDANGYIYIGCLNGNLYKIDPITGNIKWQYETGAAIRSTPAISNTGKIYFGNEKGLFSAVDTSARLFWYYKDSTAINANILHMNNTTYIGTLGGNIFAFYDKNLTSFGKTDEPEMSPMWGTFQGNSRRSGSQDSIMKFNVSIKNDHLADIKYLKVYPNPAKDELIISNEIQKLDGSQIIIFDMIGRKMIEETILNSTNEHTVLVDKLKTGAYILTIQKDGKIVRLKFVKE
jgi:outer membrane protein assembly factor BamB